MTSQARTDVSLLTRAFLLDAAYLDALQSILVKLAPKWSSRLRVLRDESSGRSSAVVWPGTPGRSLFETLSQELRHESPTLGSPEARVGAGPYARVTRQFWLEGESSAITVLLDIDEYPVAPMAGAWRFGNGITFQIQGRRLEGRPVEGWIREAVDELLATVPIDYGYAGARDEYWAKNMLQHADGIRAVGRDVSRYLPGLYWMNYFGPLYVDLIGHERLLTAPARSTRETAAGVVLMLGSTPDEWSSPDYRSTEQRVLDHLGHEFFFAKGATPAVTRAPDLPLPVLPTARQSN